MGVCWGGKREIGLGGRVVGFEGGEFAKRRGRFLNAAAPGELVGSRVQGFRERRAGFGVVGLQANYFAEMYDRFVYMVAREQKIGQVVVGVRVIRAGFKGPTVGRFGPTRSVLQLHKAPEACQPNLISRPRP